MGNFVLYLPFCYICIFVGSLSISGFPFLSGFYSKDLVLELAISRYLLDSCFVYFLGVFAAFFTALYSSRLLIFLFLTLSNNYLNCLLKESSFNMFFSIFVLSLFSIFIGHIFYDLLMGLGSFFWGNSFFYLYCDLNSMEIEFLHPFVKNIPIFFTLFGFILGFFFFYIFQFLFLFFMDTNYYFYLFLNQVKLMAFFFNSGYFNYIYNLFFLLIFDFSYQVNTKVIDKGFLEIIGPFGIYRFFRFISNFSLEFSPYVIFISICFFFISLCFIFIFIFIYIDVFFFLINNRALVFILIVLFFFEWYNIKFFINKFHV